LELDEYNTISIKRIKYFIDVIAKEKNSGNFPEFTAKVIKYSDFIPSIAALYPGQASGLEELIFNLAQKVEDKGLGIEHLIEVLSKMSTDKSTADTKASIKLMTVHASKGLQFPIVFLPCMHHSKPINDWLVVSATGDIAIKLSEEEKTGRYNTALYSSIRDYEMAAELSESKRLLYVAMTRAKEELYMVGNFKATLSKNQKKIDAGEINTTTKWLDWVAYILQDKVVDWEATNVEQVIRYKPDRMVIRIPESDVVQSDLEKYKIGRRLSVSTVRDFINCPFLMLRKVINDDVTMQVIPSAIEEMGNLVHKILEVYDDKEMLVSVYEGVNADARDKIKIIIEDFVSSAIGTKVFDCSNKLVEHAFITKIDKNVIIGRIDRMNIYSNKVWLIDYKTGVDENSLDAYKSQIACYMSFAKNVYPDKEVVGSIVDVVDCKEYLFEYGDLYPWLSKKLDSLHSFLGANEIVDQGQDCVNCKFTKDCRYLKIRFEN
jgi:ATP-dependent exoDNAse (exonuclease V) beta subunit